MNQNTEYTEYQDIRQNTPEHARTPLYRGALIAAFLLSGGVALMILSTPAAAQGPTTATPYPGPALTATAAAYNMAQAQQQQRQGAQMKAEAEAKRTQAAQLEQAGNDAISQGQASYNSAAQNAASAADALQAQQIGIANEFLARAATNIDTGRTQIDAARSAISQLRSIVDVQSGAIVSLTDRAQQAEMNVTTIRNAYTATIAAQEVSERNRMIGSIFTGLLIVAFLIVLAALVWQVISNRPAPPQSNGPRTSAEPPIEGSWVEHDEN